jgi:uncharacterized membrane protein (DUF4010 family)
MAMYETLIGLYTHDYFRFLLTLFFSFLTGLELREYKQTLKNSYFIGTVRTQTFIGMMGYILYILDTSMLFYLAGFAILALLFGLFYQHKLQEGQKGIISILVGLLVYTYAPIIMTQPLWFAALIFVSVIFVINAKTQVQFLSSTMDNSEMITFAKLVLLSVVIWPLLPTTLIATWIPFSLSKIWMSVVIVSGISYIGYLLQRYFFAEKGLLINGFLGGLYSSTATTLVISRYSQSITGHDYTLVSATVFATAVMYARLLAILGVLSASLFYLLLVPMLALGTLSLVVGILLARLQPNNGTSGADAGMGHVNPLELGVALVFALMFVVMGVLTHYIVGTYGSSGLNILAFMSGVTDIDPFVLSLINGSYNMDKNTLACAILIAAGSNNLFKGIIAISTATRKVGWMSFTVLTLLALATFIVAWILWLH